jgi:tetratricopeptide (TPR) repeat protein
VAVYRRVIHLSRRLGDSFGEARACTNLGYFYVDQGYLYRAEVLCCHALTLFDQINNHYGLAHTENHLGALYLRQHAWDKAQYHFERACQFWELLNNQNGLMYGYMNLGVLYVYTKQADQALLFSEKALDRARNAGGELDVGNIYINMGLAHQLKGDLATAEKLTWQAEAIFRRFSNLIGLAHAHENLGLIYLEQQKWPETGLHLAEALAAWRTLGNKHNEIQTAGYLAKYELARGNFQEAKLWLKEAEERLRQYGPAGRDHQLQKQIEELHLGLDKGEQDKSPQ